MPELGEQENRIVAQRFVIECDARDIQIEKGR